MKSLLLSSLTALLLLLLLSSCQEPGTTTNVLSDNSKLPAELKGLKVYKVTTENGNRIFVGILPNKNITNVQFPQGKGTANLLLVNDIDDVNNDNNTVFIKVSNVVFENDSMILCRK